MKVLVACEFSGIVREAFSKRGHDAWSYDYLDTEIPGNHIKDNVLKHLNEGWDLMIAHPPCTYLTVACPANYTEYWRKEKKEYALRFVWELMGASIKQIAIENPLGAIGPQISPPTQIIQPWQFGHEESKRTCLWLKNLPKLRPTKIVEFLHYYVHWQIPSNIPGWKYRSKTFVGIAEAMAEQWG